MDNNWEYFQFNARFNCVVSVDTVGMIEYWAPEEPFELPSNLKFEMKSETDLYEFRKVRFCKKRKKKKERYVTVTLYLCLEQICSYLSDLLNGWIAVCHHEFPRSPGASI